MLGRAVEWTTRQSQNDHKGMLWSKNPPTMFAIGTGLSGTEFRRPPISLSEESLQREIVARPLRLDAYLVSKWWHRA